MVRPAPALLLILVLTISPAPLFSAENSGTGDQAQGFLIFEGRVVAFGAVPGEGELDLVTATLSTETGAVSVALAPRSVFHKTGFLLREGDNVVVRLFQGLGEATPTAQMVNNRTRNRAIRLRSIRGEPLWDGKGRWQGGFCTHDMELQHAARR